VYFRGAIYSVWFVTLQSTGELEKTQLQNRALQDEMESYYHEIQCIWSH